MGIWLTVSKAAAHKGDQVTLTWTGAPKNGRLFADNGWGVTNRWEVTDKPGKDSNVHVISDSGTSQQFFLAFQPEGGGKEQYSNTVWVKVKAPGEPVDAPPAHGDIGMSAQPMGAAHGETVKLFWKEDVLAKYVQSGFKVFVNGGQGKEFPASENPPGTDWHLYCDPGTKQGFFLTVRDGAGNIVCYSNTVWVPVSKPKGPDVPVWSDFNLRVDGKTETEQLPGETVNLTYDKSAKLKDGQKIFVNLGRGYDWPEDQCRSGTPCHILVDPGQKQQFFVVVKEGDKPVAYSNTCYVKAKGLQGLDKMNIDPAQLGPKIKSFGAFPLDEDVTGGGPAYKHISAQVERGTKLKLRWDVDGPVKTFKIDGAPGVTNEQNEVVVTPSGNCNYTLYATNDLGQTSKAQVWVSVHQPGEAWSYHVPLQPFPPPPPEPGKPDAEKKEKEKEPGEENKNEDGTEFELSLFEGAKSIELFSVALVSEKGPIKSEYLKVDFSGALEFSGGIKAKIPKKEGEAKEEVKTTLEKLARLFPVADLVKNLTDLDHDDAQWEGGWFTGIQPMAVEKGEKGKWGLSFADIKVGKATLKVPGYGKNPKTEAAELGLDLTGVKLEIKVEAGKEPEVELLGCVIEGSLEVPLFKLEFNEEGYFPCEISAKLKASLAGGITPKGFYKLAECAPELLVLVVAVVIEVAVFAWIMGDLLDSDSEMAKEAGAAGAIAEAVIEGYRDGLRGTSAGRKLKATDAATAKLSGAFHGAEKRKQILSESLKGNAAVFDAWLNKHEKEVMAQCRDQAWQAYLLPLWKQRAAHQLNTVSELYWFCRNTLDRLQTSWFFYIGSTCPLKMTGSVWVTAWREMTNDLYLEEFVKDPDKNDNKRYADLVSGFW